MMHSAILARVGSRASCQVVGYGLPIFFVPISPGPDAAASIRVIDFASRIPDLLSRGDGTPGL